MVMPAMLHRLAPVLLVATAALGGCLAAPGPSSGAVDGEVPVVHQAGIDDPERVAVQVVDPTTEPATPIVGAQVVFFTNAHPDPGVVYYLDNLEDRCGELAFGEEPLRILAEGTTGPDGRLVGLVDPTVERHDEYDQDHMPVGVAVGGVDGYTTEAYFGGVEGISYPCGFSYLGDTSEGNTTDVVASIYPETVPFDLEGTLDAEIATPQDRAIVPGPTWWPTEVHGDGGLDPYALRLAHVSANLTWSNGPEGWADLYLGFGDPGRTPEIVGEDRSQGPLDEDNVEHLDADLEGLFLVSAIGPATDQPVVTAGGIEYRINGELTFEGADVRLPADGT